MRNKTPQAALIPITGERIEENSRNIPRSILQSLGPRGIQARLIGLIILALVPLLLLLTWIYYQHFELSRTQALQTELEVARGIATTFSTYNESIHQQNNIIGKAILSSMMDDREKMTALLTDMVNQSPAVRNISWAEPNGIVVASSLPELAGRSLAARRYFQDVRSGEDWAIGDLTNQGIATNAPTLAIATAIKDESGVLRGVVVTGLEPDRLNEVVLTLERPAGGAYAIFDRNGSVVYHSDSPAFSWEERLNWVANDSLLQQVLKTGEEQTGIETLEIPGGEWISARVPVPGIGFVVGAGRPTALAFQPVLDGLLREGLLALGIWCMAFIFALLISRTISLPLHLLEQDARAMGSGQLETRDDPLAPEEVRNLRRTVENMAFTLIHRADALRMSETTLRESEARFRVLFHNRHSPMLLIDPATGQIEDANPAASEYYGWSQETLQSMKITDINQLAPDRTRQEMRHALGSETSKLFHFRHRLANGEIRDVEVNSGPIKINGREYLFSIIHDITERVRAEQEMRERNEGMSLLSEAAQELLSGSDPITLLDLIYPRLSALLKLDAYFHFMVTEDGSQLQLAGHSELPTDIATLIQRVNMGETVCGRAALERQPIILNDVQQSQESDTRLIRSLGITAYACHPLLVQNQLVGTLSFGSRRRSDFDPQSVHLMRTTANLLAAAIYRRQAEATLQIYAQKLEESNNELQAFAFIASHDLQEPLRKVESFGNLIMQDSANLEDRHRDYLDRMRQAAGRMRRMVMDLLELSRVNTQGRAFELVNLDAVAQDVISDLEVQIHQVHGKVELEGLPQIQADPMQIHQLLQNLIGNGLKYHRTEETPLVRLTGKKIAANRVEIRIVDNGIGFDPNQTERIFQPFQRLVGRSEYEGTGIGLAICRKIIERHQGTITAESEPGHGSVFIVQLPVHHPINRTAK